MAQNIYLSCFAKKRGRPRKAPNIDSIKERAHKSVVKKTTLYDPLDKLYEKSLIDHKQFQACLHYRGVYYRYCRLSFVPVLSQNRYGLTSASAQPYYYCGDDHTNDGVIHKAYMDLRQEIAKEFGKARANRVHHLLLFANHSLDQEDIKLIQDVSTALIKQRY